MDTYLYNTADARQEMDRRFELHAVNRNAYTCEIPDRYSRDIELGDMVTLIANRFGLESGKLMVVIGRLIDLEQRTNTLTLWG